MRKSIASGLLVLLFSGTSASAKTSTYEGIRESNDPQRTAEIENKASQISGQSSTETGGTGTTSEAPKSGGKKEKLHSKHHKKSHKQATSDASQNKETTSGSEKNSAGSSSSE